MSRPAHSNGCSIGRDVALLSTGENGRHLASSLQSKCRNSLRWERKGSVESGIQQRLHVVGPLVGVLHHNLDLNMAAGGDVSNRHYAVGPVE